MSYIEEILEPQLRIDEGVRAKPYIDTVGKTTIGVGRNLTDVGVDSDEISVMLANDIGRAEALARRLVQNFDALSDARKAVVVNMAFNLAGGLSAFTHTLQAINESRWDDAAAGMLASHWAGQVGARAQRLAAAMKEG